MAQVKKDPRAADWTLIAAYEADRARVHELLSAERFIDLVAAGGMHAGADAIQAAEAQVGITHARKQQYYRIVNRLEQQQEAVME